MVCRQVGRRSAFAPVEINLRFVPHQHRIPLKLSVAEVLTLPAAERFVALPPEPHQRHARALEVVHLDGVKTCTEGHVNRVDTRGALFPLIQHESVVDVKSEAVVDLDVKAIDPRIEVERPRPSSAEMVHAQSVVRRSLAPIEEDHQIVACEKRRSRLVWIIPVIAPPVGDDERRRRGHSRHRRCRRRGRRWYRRLCCRCRWCRRRRVRLLHRRCLRRSRSRHLDVLPGLEERGRLVPAIRRVCKHDMRARCQPARADRVKKTRADRARRVRRARSQNTAATALIAQRDQH